MSKILIVVDMQNDFVYGALGTPEAQNIVDSVVRKVSEARENGDMVIFTADKHCFDDGYNDSIEGKYVPPHCIENTYGAEIIPELEPVVYYVASKSTYGYQLWGDWHHMFEDADEIELCGVCTDICVISNALILRSMYPNAPIVVDATCCAGLSYERHEAALAVMQSCNIKVMYPF